MQKKLLIMLSVIFVMLTTFAYSALSTSLAITSEVELRPLADIRVTGISLSATDGATVQYESEYSKDTITSGFILPTSNASISYTVRIDNAGDVDYAIYDILRTSCSDTGLTYSVSGYNIGDVIPARTTLNMVITYTTTTPSNNVIAVVNTMDFRKVFYVSYNTGTSQTISQQTKYENIPLTLTSTVPTKNGYTFANWNTNPNGTGVNYNSGASYTLDESKILYAIWNITNYNITYSLKNGVVSSANPSTYNVESSSITLTNPTKTLTFVGNYNTTAGAKADSNSGVVIGNNTTSNQTFAGWSGTDLNNNTTTVTIPTGSYGDRSYTAHWTAVAGNTPTVTRDGYTCGWNTSENGTTIQISSGGSYATSRITEDMNTTVNLYAVCTPNTYNISYTLNNGTVSGTNPTSYTPESSSITLINPTKTLTFHGNYNSSSSSNANSSSGVQIGSNTSGAQGFAGWSGTGLANNTTTVTIPTGSYGDRSYTAHWTATGVTLPTVTRSGYTCGWNKTNRATTITYASGGTYPTSEITESMSTSTINLYAVCTRVTYTIAYEMNGGPNPSTKPTTGTYNSSVNITNPNSKTFTVNINANSQNATIGSNSVSATQTFAGWTSTTIGPNAKTGTSSSTQNTAWDGSLTTRRYFKNLRDDDGTVTMVANWNNANATLPTITKTGSTCGYATAPDGAIVYSSGASYATDTSTNSVTLYAKCSAATYTVQYCQGNNSTTAGYSCSQNTSTHTYDVVSSLNSYASSGLTAPTGWTFAGWNTSSTGTGVTYTDEENVTNLSSSSGTVNLYAVFKKQFNAISGVSGATNTTLWQYYNPYRTTGYLTSITLPSLTSITNWSSLGYRLDTTADAATISTGVKTPLYDQSATTYYATYSRELTITYNGNDNDGGSTSNTTKTVYMNTNQTTTSSQEVTLANNGFTKTSYTFNKWAEGSTSGTQYSEGATYNPNLAYNAATFGTTMYALWIPTTYTVQYCVGNNSTTAGYTCSSTTSTHSVDIAQNLTSYSTLGLSTPTGWTFAGWNTTPSGTTATYTDGVSVVNLASTGGDTVNLYAVYKKDLRLYGGRPSSSTTRTQYYNPYTTSTLSSIDLNASTQIPNWTALGYRTDTTAGEETYSLGQQVTPAYDETPSYYEVYTRDLTIQYNGNGNTGGSVNGIIKPIYLNAYSNTTSSQEVTLATNTITKSGYSFVDWTEGSTSGTHYNAGATYNPNLAYNAASFDIVMYANWLGMYHNIVWDYNYQTSSLISYVSTAQFTFTNNTSSSYPGEKTARGGIAISFAGSSGNRPQAKTNATYSLTAGKTYTLSLFAKTNLSAAGQDIAYGITDSLNTTTFVCDGISNTYKRCSTTFTVEDTGSYNVFVSSNEALSANTTIYFHSLDLSEVSAANGLVYDDSTKTMTFDGVDDWWNMGVRNSNSQSLDVTFVTGNTAPTNNYILGNWQSGGGGILISGSGYICGNYYITEEATYKSVCTTYKAQANTEYHVGWTYDGITMKLYINGEFYNSLDVTGTIGVPSSSTVMSLGSNPAGTSGGEDFFKGTIKGARVYNTVKSAEDIRRNYLFDQGDDVEGCIAASGLVYSITRYDVVGINRSIWSRRANEAIGSVASVSRSGYTFDGWWTDPVGGTQVTADTIMSNSNMTVYAHWKYNMTLNFRPNGGTVSPTSKTVFYNEPRGELPTPTKSGYYFGGWGWNGVPTGTNGYTTLTYITGDGSHYIDTGHYTTPNTGIYMDYQFDDPSVLQQRLFSVNNNNPSSLYYEMYINGSGKLAYAYQDNDGNWISTGVDADTNRRVIRFNVNNTKKILIDTTSTSNGSIYNGNISGSPTLTSNITMKVFTHGRVGAKAKAKLYAFKIYENGTLVSDMVPVRRNSDNVEGLYDKYQQKFHSLNNTIELTNTYIKTAVENEPYSGSETLYARWLTTPFNSTVSYNCTQTGGSGSIASETVAINGAIDLTKTCTPPSGFTHIGWNKSSTAKEALPSLEMGTSNITLYAIYRSSSEYSATFNLQDNVGITMTGGTTSCYRYNGASSCSITSPTIVANAGNGTTIVGWSETANTHSATYSNGANISINSNKTYYSITQRTFNVNFVRNSHVTGIGSADQDQSVPCTIWNNESACSVTSPSTIIVASGYKANGFNTDANATTSTWNANSTKNIRVPTTYYGIAKGIDYSVKFNANCPSGVTPTGSMSNQSMVYGASSNLSANEFSCAGYSFLKWTTNQDGTGNSYTNGQSVNNLTTTENATVNLYAQWGQLWAENIAYDNTNTGVNCTDTQCMLDYLSSLYATPTSFANDSWFTIAKTVRENPTFYPVGATKTISMDVDDNGTPETYTLRVANNTTPAECSTQGFSQTACGFVVEFANIVTQHRMNPAVSGTTIGTGNIGGWEYSEIRAWLNSTTYTAGPTDFSSDGFYNKLPEKLKNVIIPTIVVSGYGNNDSGLFTTTDNLYLLSTHEVYEDTDGNANSGIDQYDNGYSATRQLDYYALQQVTTTNYSNAIKTMNGNAIMWSLRSPRSNIIASFYLIDATGNGQVSVASANYGVSPAFRIG